MLNSGADAMAASAAEAPLVRIDRDGPVVRLTLNRAAKYNVLSAAMMAALRESLESMGSDRSVRVIVLAAEVVHSVPGMT